jgi:hypothetical protein
LSSFLAEENAVKDGQFRIARFKQQLLQLFLNFWFVLERRISRNRQSQETRNKLYSLFASMSED